MPKRCFVGVRLRNDEVDGHLVVGIRYVSPYDKNAASFKTPVLIVQTWLSLKTC